mgnify:CR=1 FL=1
MGDKLAVTAATPQCHDAPEPRLGARTSPYRDRHTRTLDPVGALDRIAHKDVRSSKEGDTCRPHLP